MVIKFCWEFPFTAKYNGSDCCNNVNEKHPGPLPSRKRPGSGRGNDGKGNKIPKQQESSDEEEILDDIDYALSFFKKRSGSA